MRRPVDPPALTEVSRALGGVRESLVAVEDDLLSSLVVMGEPEPQRAVDGWVDQVLDLLRAVDEVTTHHAATITRAVARRPDAATPHATSTSSTTPGRPLSSELP